jgi:hypothetical protein
MATKPRGKEITLSDQSKTPADGATVSILIPTDFDVQKTRLYMRLLGNISGAITPNPNGLKAANYIEVLTMNLDGTTVHFSGSGVDYFRKNKYAYGTGPINTLTTATTGTGVEIGVLDISLDSMIDVNNSEDYTSIINLFKKSSSLTLTVKFATAAALGNTITITGGELVATIKQADLTPKEVKMLSTPHLQLYDSIQEKPAAAATAFSFVFDNIPTGKMIKQIAIAVIDNGVPSDTLVTGMQMTVGGNPIKTWGFLQSKNSDKYEYGVETLETGYTILDFEDIGGLDLRGVDVKSAKLGFNVGSPTGTANIRLHITEVE